MLNCRAEIGGHVDIDLTFLVDTGAEVNVIHQGLIPEHLLTHLAHPWRLTAANQQNIAGGDKEAHLTLLLEGKEVDTQRPRFPPLFW